MGAGVGYRSLLFQWEIGGRAAVKAEGVGSARSPPKVSALVLKGKQEVTGAPGRRDMINGSEQWKTAPVECSGSEVPGAGCMEGMIQLQQP